MTIAARVILDSISSDGVRLTTLALRYPRFIHSEFMTHRVFSRNAASSRATPVEKMCQDVENDPAMPLYWGLNQPGMQADEEMDEERIWQAKQTWLRGMRYAVAYARELAQQGLHKQNSNRILEPYAHIDTLVTATEYSNFFNLRLHETAQPEIRVLAQEMFAAMLQTEPQFLTSGEFHLPYIGKDEDAPLHVLKKASVARCARLCVSREGRPRDLDADFALYDRLITAEPAHASPAEHVASPDVSTKGGWENPHLHGNFAGWVQFRKAIGL